MLNEYLSISYNEGKVELTFSVPVRFFQLITCNKGHTVIKKAGLLVHLFRISQYHCNGVYLWLSCRSTRV